MTLGEIALTVAAVPALFACGYLGLLTMLSGRARPPQPRAPHLRFDVVVPAHDEERGIASTVKSLLAMDYPRDLFRVTVVADNCLDDTAERALEAGAKVMVRDDLKHIGKGHALAHAFKRLATEASTCADAIAVVDADTIVSRGLLRAFAARIEAGASAIQANYGVRNSNASWRTRLAAIAFATFHELRSLARERLGVSCGLRGNGMCFTSRLLREVPYDALSIVEDLEAGIRLGEAGHRVCYASEARVYGEMVSTGKHSHSQRARWGAGRWRMTRTFVPRLLSMALRGRDAIALDLAFDLMVPPLSTLLAIVALGLAVSIGVSLHVGELATAVWLWGVCALALTAYGLRGWKLSGTGVRGLLGLAYVPVFVAWKLTLPFRRSRGAHEWIRTTREGETR